jgi:hypothetical protein
MDEPSKTDEPCDHAGAEILIDRATGEETCSECGKAVGARVLPRPPSRPAGALIGF